MKSMLTGSRRYIVLSRIVSLVAVMLTIWTNSADGEDDDSAMLFQRRPVKSATYAIFTESVVGSEKDTAATLYRIEYERTKPRIKIESVFDEPIEHDEYRAYKADLRYSADLMTSLTGSTRGGEMGALREMQKRGHPLAFWGGRWWQKHYLVFPVFDNEGKKLRLGDKWTCEAAPFVQDESLWEGLLQGKVKLSELSPTLIDSHWRTWEEKNGFRCAVIDFSFDARSDPKVVVGKESSAYSLSGTSYFSVEMGVPVVTELKAKGFITNEKGERREVKLTRREALAAIDNEKITKEE